MALRGFVPLVSALAIDELKSVTNKVACVHSVCPPTPSKHIESFKKKTFKLVKTHILLHSSSRCQKKKSIKLHTVMQFMKL